MTFRTYSSDREQGVFLSARNSGPHIPHRQVQGLVFFLFFLSMTEIKLNFYDPFLHTIEGNHTPKVHISSAESQAFKLQLQGEGPIPQIHRLRRLSWSVTAGVNVHERLISEAFWTLWSGCLRLRWRLYVMAVQAALCGAGGCARTLGCFASLLHMYRLLPRPFCTATS